MIGFGTDTAVTEKQYKAYKEKVVIAARKSLKARDIVGAAPRIIGKGKRTWHYDDLTEMSEAIMAFNFVKTKGDTDLTPHDVKMPVLQKDFQMEELDVEASKTEGEPLIARNVNAATYQVAILENQAIVKGNTTYGVNGFYDGAGLDYSTTKDFATYKNAMLACGGAMDLMLNKNITPPLRLVLPATQYVELMASQSSTGVREAPAIRDLIGGEEGEGAISLSPYLTAGTGMLIEKNGASAGHFELVVGSEFDVALKNIHLADGGGVKGKVYVISRLMIYDSNAICKLSDI